MTFEEKRFKDLTDNGLGTSEFELLSYELGRKAARQETLREVIPVLKALVVETLGAAKTGTLACEEARDLLKKLEAEREG